MNDYKRGAFLLADQLQLPVVPITINGSFRVKPRTKDFDFVVWHPLRLTIHKPLQPIGQGADNRRHLCEKSREATLSALDTNP